jgi:hypothetical protein
MVRRSFPRRRMDCRDCTAVSRDRHSADNDVAYSLPSSPPYRRERGLAFIGGHSKASIAKVLVDDLVHQALYVLVR